jgi:hypothetical protein
LARKTAIVLGSSCFVAALAAGCGSPDTPTGAAASSADSSSSASGSSSTGATTSGSGGVGGIGGSASSAGGMGGSVSTASSAAGTGGAMSSTSGAGGATSSSGGIGGAGGMGGASGTTATGGQVCAPGVIVPCYSGPPGTEGVGQCQSGTQTCDALGDGFGPCIGEVLPSPETCTTAIDDDCNGQTNEGGAGCACVPGSTTSCYSGPMGTLGVGSCVGGIWTCNALGTGYGGCVGEVVPQPETCATPGDDDCNGQTNEDGVGCVCAPNTTASCYSGPAGTAGVGICAAGNKTCNAQGTAYGACAGEVVPQTETCTNSVDDDCNGQVNESGTGCVCAPNTAASCYSGPAGTAGVGLCVAGSRTCNAQGTAYGACGGEVDPQPLENCNTAGDDDCNGAVCAGPYLFSKEWGSATDDEGFVVTTDASGNILVAGYFTGTADFGCGPLTAPAAGDAALMLKLGPTGNCLWNKTFGNNAHITGGVVDAAGNIYVAGYFFNTIDLGGGVLTAGADDTFVAKYSAAGVYQWGKQFGDGASQEATGLSIDGAGNLYVTGFFVGQINFGGGNLTSNGSTDVYLAKLTSAGAYVWAKGFGDGSAQRSYGIGTDSAGNTVVTGTYQGTINFGGATLTNAGLNDGFLARFNTAGTHLWSKRFGDAGDQVGYAVALDSSGNTYSSGHFGGSMNLGSTPATLLTSQGGYDAYLAKLDSLGNLVWSKAFGAAGNQTSFSVAVDWSGSVAFSCSLTGTVDFGGGPITALNAASDIVLARYTSSGGFVWAQRFGDVGTDQARRIWFDPSGNLFATGITTTSLDFGGGPLPWVGGEDIFLVKLGP